MDAWQEATDEILRRTDILECYRRAGVETVGTPSPSGWARAYALRGGNREAHPSAGVNVRTGRYRDHGSGLSLSFFDAMAHFGDFPDWQAARAHYAERAGVSLPKGRPPDAPDAKIEIYRVTPPEPLASYAALKGVRPSALALAGARFGCWPRNAPPGCSHEILAFPAYAAADSDPCRYVIAHSRGLDLVAGRGTPGESRAKVRTVGGKRGGLLNPHFWANLRDCEIAWKVEGLSDMLALQDAIPPALRDKHLVTANSGGASERPPPDLCAALALAPVAYVVGDADAPGQAGASAWARAIPGARSVTLPYPVAASHGRDLRDYLASHTYEDLLSLAACASPPEAPEEEPSIDEAITRALRMEVLGELEDGCVAVYSTDRRKVSAVRVRLFSFADLLQLVGPRARDVVSEDRNPPPGLYSMSEVRNAIACQGGAVRISTLATLGAGVWHVDGHALLVDPGGAVSVSPSGEQAVHNVPRFSSRILDYSGPHWLDRDLFFAPSPPSRVAELVRYFSQWRFARPGAAELCAGLILATWTQTAWPWRPLVVLTGPSSTGKTTFLEFASSLFGPLAIRVQKPSEAGIRQHVGTSARPLFIDEFEQDFHRRAVLELLRTASRGGSVARGTASQQARVFSLRHVVWVAAIEAGLGREPDRNRAITLELCRFDPTRHGDLSLPQRPQGFGHALLSLAVASLPAALSLYPSLSRERFPGASGRVVESYAVPAAAYAAATGADPRVVLSSFLPASEAAEADELVLLQEILSSHVRDGPAHLTVSEILSDPSSYALHREALERHGVASFTPNQRGPRLTTGSHVFFSPRAVKRHLLAGTSWNGDTDLPTILMRLPGAEHCQASLAGGRPRGVSIPSSLLPGPPPDPDFPE